MLLINAVVTRRGNVKKDKEKLSPYECGFEPFEDARLQFDVHYYVIGILFLFFDLEIAFLFPWACLITKLSFSGVFVGIFFFFIITIGYLYEWFLGLLDL